MVSQASAVMETRIQKSEQAKTVLMEKEVSVNAGHDEMEVDQKEETKISSPAMKFYNKNHNLRFEETFVNTIVGGLKTKIEEKISSLIREKLNLMEENRTNEIKLVQIEKEFNKVVFELNQTINKLDSGKIEQKRTKEALEQTKECLEAKQIELNIMKVTMSKTKYELDITKVELNNTDTQLRQKEEDLYTIKEDLERTKLDVIKGKKAFKTLEHKYETNMESLESTKITLKLVQNELASSKVELIRTENAYSAKFDAILARSKELNIEKDKFEIEHQHCDSHVKKQLEMFQNHLTGIKKW